MTEGRKDFSIDGKLIIVEGIDGSGKSTQIRLLEKWLRYIGIPVFFTEWNSSEQIKEIISIGKKKNLLTPTTFSLLHATDFAGSTKGTSFHCCVPAMSVLADRYIYTAFARDVVRGCSPEWVRNVYSLAVKPDIAFYFKVPVEVSFDRIVKNRPKLKYYEAGMDLNLSNDPYESYRIFQGRIIDEYESMVEPEGLTVIDGTKDIEEQQELMRQKVKEILPQQMHKNVPMPGS